MDGEKGNQLSAAKIIIQSNELRKFNGFVNFISPQMAPKWLANENGKFYIWNSFEMR